MMKGFPSTLQSKFLDKRDIHLSVLMISTTVERNTRTSSRFRIHIHGSSEKLLWIEVPSKGFFASGSELQREVELDLAVQRAEDLLFLDGEADNPYRCLPPKDAWDPPVFSEEMDKILYPDLKHMENATDHTKAWEELGVALKAHNDEMNKIKYPNGPPDVVELCDSDLEHYQVWHM
ncbi:hypothetical protein MKW98_012841 [Papaver atlanticum]|uniref:Uncharacterized protein n=1 Tax=Papaver atlanticum TaxID=357466 RepID=A0AAD4XHD8_9MAGN|nr:hypothetical protein MKW98_012841 [Papaver atlanticum]